MAISKLHALMALSGTAAIGVPVAAFFVINSQEGETFSNNANAIAGSNNDDTGAAVPGTVPSALGGGSSDAGTVTTEGQDPSSSDPTQQGGQPVVSEKPEASETSPSEPASGASGTVPSQSAPVSGAGEATKTTTTTEKTCTVTDTLTGVWSILYKNIVGTTAEGKTPDSAKLERWKNFMKSQGKDCQGNALNTGTGA